MNVILYMAISVNGYITYKDDDTSWVSPEDFEGQAEVAKRTGNIIYGKKTYDIGVIEKAVPVPECLNVVMTHHVNSLSNNKDFLFTNKSPQEVIAMLTDKGFTEVLVAGGSTINHLFLTENIIDEVYLDIEPVLIGQGLPLFIPTLLRYELELLGCKMLANKKTMQLHYRVVK